MGCWCARTGQNRATLFSLEQRDRGTGKHARWQGITRQKGCPKSKSKKVCVLSPTHALGAGRHLEVLKIKGFRREGWRPAAGRCRTRGLPRAAPRHASRARARWAAGSALQRGGGKGRGGGVAVVFCYCRERGVWAPGEAPAPSVGARADGASPPPTVLFGCPGAAAVLATHRCRQIQAQRGQSRGGAHLHGRNIASQRTHKEEGLARMHSSLHRRQGAQGSPGLAAIWG